MAELSGSFTESPDGEIEIVDVDDRSDSPIAAILKSLKFRDDDEFTITVAQQQSTEKNVEIYHNEMKTQPEQRATITLRRAAHRQYLVRGLHYLNYRFQGLDASQPWICYWIINSLDVLGFVPDPADDIEKDKDMVPHETLSNMVKFLESCVDQTFGSYAGGPYQLAHLAPTYAAINALCIIGTEEAYKSIDRKRIYNFLLAMKDDCGGFRMHENGELDIRATYCALNTAYLLNLLDEKLLHKVGTFLHSCQTYEGGISAEPGNEAHGGYAFCGLATGIISNTFDQLDLDRLLYWACSRQKGFEGGFQGRTNKLVDGCYSFWQGALFPLLNKIRPFSMPPVEDIVTSPQTSPFEETLHGSSWLCNQRGLQDYLLLCCQPIGGGLCDKPPKSSDYYHTCYALNGLSSMQHNADGKPPTVIGKAENLVLPIDPLHGFRVEKSARAKEFFGKLAHPCPV